MTTAWRGALSWRPARPDASLLVTVAVSAAAVQAWVNVRMPLGPDEGVYASQVSPRISPDQFSAPRARGTSWLTAPVIRLTDDVRWWRLYLVVVAMLVLVAACWPWLRVLPRRTVPIAAALFSVLWITLLYAPTLMPNYWVAMSALGATGWLLRARRGSTDRWALPLAGLFVAAAAVVRPSDAASLVAGLVVSVLLVPGWHRGRTIALIAGAGVAGATPWVVEAYRNYGGVVARLHSASAIQGGLHPQPAVVFALRSIDGPLLCRPCATVATPGYAFLWLLAPAALLVLGGLAAWRWRLQRVVAVTLLTALATAAVYLFLIGYGAPRFLLPAAALLSMPSALGVLWAWQRSGARKRVLARSGLAVGLALFVATQLVLVGRVGARAYRARAAIVAEMTTLAAAGLVAPCAVSGRFSNMRAVLSGCRQVSRRTAMVLGGPNPQQGAARTEAVALFLSPHEHAPHWSASWQTLRLHDRTGRQHRVYLSLPAAP